MIKRIDKWINKKLNINYKWKMFFVLIAFIIGLTIKLILTPS